MIQIDIEMPENCLSCPFLHRPFSNNTFCHAKAEEDFIDKDSIYIKRQDFCPLKEVSNNSALEDIKSEIKEMRSKQNCSCSDCLDIIDKHMESEDNK